MNIRTLFIVRCSFVIHGKSPGSQAIRAYCVHKISRDLIFLQTLEDKIAALEGGEGVPAAAGKPKEPEPILTCVQCSAEYKESENAGWLLYLLL